MSRIDVIKENYRSMSDIQLLHLANHEIGQLTAEAQFALKEELERRKINLETDVNPDATHTRTIDFNNVEKHIIQYIITQKKLGESDAFITGGLLERGLDEANIEMLLAQFPEYIKARKHKMAQMILTGILQLVTGLAIKSLPLNKQSNLVLLILAYALIILGAIRITHGYFNKRKLDMVTSSI